MLPARQREQRAEHVVAAHGAGVAHRPGGRLDQVFSVNSR